MTTRIVLVALAWGMLVGALDFTWQVGLAGGMLLGWWTARQ